MVVVFVSAQFPGDQQHVPEQYLESYILPAARSQGPLRANPEQTALLEARLHDLANPTPKPVPPLPALATRISGKPWTLQDNLLGMKTFMLEFTEADAAVSLPLEGTPQYLRIGMDDVFRLTHIVLSNTPTITLALKGAWLSDDTFTVRDCPKRLKV